MLSENQRPNLTVLSSPVNKLLERDGETLYRHCVEKYRPFLNSNEVRELSLRGLLDSPDAPRPAPRLIANQTTVILHTYHRARESSPTKKLAGEWAPRLKVITLTPRIARILLTRFSGSLTSESKKRLNRVANGWQPRQRVPKTQSQAVYA